MVDMARKHMLKTKCPDLNGLPQEALRKSRTQRGFGAHRSRVSSSLNPCPKPNSGWPFAVARAG